MRAIFTCPSFHPVQPFHSYDIIDQRSRARNDDYLTMDDDYDWAEEVEELVALHPTSTELEFDIVQHKRTNAATLESQEATNDSLLLDWSDEAEELAALHPTLSELEHMEKTNQTTLATQEEVSMPFPTPEGPSPNIHHINYQGTPVTRRSSTFPEVSAWFAARQPWLKKTGYGINRRRVTIGQASKYIDPVVYTGPHGSMIDGTEPGTRFCTAMSGLVQKAYQPVGLWLSDKYEHPEVPPTIVSATDPGVWNKDTFEELPDPCTGTECYPEIIVNDDGRVHLPRLPKDFHGHDESRLCFVEHSEVEEQSEAVEEKEAGEEEEEAEEVDEDDNEEEEAEDEEVEGEEAEDKDKEEEEDDEGKYQDEDRWTVFKSLCLRVFSAMTRAAATRY